MEDDFLQDIQAKYSAIEVDLEEKLSKLTVKEENSPVYKVSSCANSGDGMGAAKTDLGSAIQRNQAILRELEITKARLRSRALYSPVVAQLSKLKKLYLETVYPSSQDSTPTRIKKIYGPTFV